VQKVTSNYSNFNVSFTASDSNNLQVKMIRISATESQVVFIFGVTKLLLNPECLLLTIIAALLLAM